MFSGFDFINHLGGNTGREVRTSGEPHSDQRVTSPGVFLNISAFRKNVIVANRTNAADGRSSHEKIAIAAELTALSFEPVAAKLCFHTKEGTQEFVINDQIAHDLAHMLCTFLLGGQCDTEPFGVAPLVS